MRLPNHLLVPAAIAMLAIAANAQGPLQHRGDPIPAQVDIAYQKGLEYLATNQNDDGYWNDNSGDEPGVVGLCVVAFLARGEDPVNGPYANHIRKGLDYIISKQDAATGYIGNSMYNHAFATLALAESYGMVQHPQVATTLSKAVELILSAQKNNRFHAWRYTPSSSDADTTVAGCQIVSLLAARNAGIPVPQDAIRKGLGYLTNNRHTNGSYGYTSTSGGKPTLTAIGMLCLSLANEDDTKPFTKSLEYLKGALEYRDSHYPYYFEYYMSQALFHADETTWNHWNQQNIRYMSTIQNNNGAFPGNQGAAFSTAGALLSLALNYRFLPIYEK